MLRGIVVELENNSYEFRYDINAICRLEKKIGKSVSSLGEDSSMSEIRAMTVCALSGRKDQMTDEDAGAIMQKIINEKGMDVLTEALSDAIEMAIPSGKSKKSEQE